MSRTIYANQVAFNMLYKLKGKQLADEGFILREASKLEKTIYSKCKIPVFIELYYPTILESLRSYGYFDRPETGKYSIREGYKEIGMLKKINSRFDKDIQRALKRYIGPFIKLNKLKKKKAR